ncbi:MAG: hypothetical protein JXR97_12320 [Planctomycetes bacterium]|nr:hypothetical protein [Planctomycetota bacterium]
MSEAEKIEKAKALVNHLIKRVATAPEFAHHFWGTRSLELLVEAQLAFYPTGNTFEQAMESLVETANSNLPYVGSGYLPFERLRNDFVELAERIDREWREENEISYGAAEDAAAVLEKYREGK